MFHEPSATSASLIEKLEDRRLMSGSVSAVVQGGNLSITGDDEDNQIIIYRAAGTVRILGLDDTTVNGKEGVKIGNFSKGLRISFTQGGQDNIALQGAFNIPGNLRADFGAGELLVEGSSGAVKVGGNVTVNAGEEGTASLRNDVQVKGKTTINSGDVNVVSGFANVPNYSAARFDHSLNINNPYFPVVPGGKLVYRASGVDEETDEPFTEKIVVEMLPATKTILGVKARIVRDRVYKDGVLIEDTFDWYAQDNNGNVWYLGEDVTNYEYDEKGKLLGVDKDGSWIAGKNGAQAGIVMEAKPRIGHRYYQEFSPGDVLDQAVGVGFKKKMRLPAGTFKNLFVFEESSVTEPAALAQKSYAPGIGIASEYDFDLADNDVVQSTRLVSATLNGKPVKQFVPTSGFNGQNASYRRSIDPARLGDKVELHAVGTLILNHANVNGALTAGTKENLFILDSDLYGGASLSAGEEIALRGVFAEKPVTLSGNADSYVLNSQFGKLAGVFGNADNSFSVRDSIFDSLDLNGGGGSNAFADHGGNDFGTLKLKNFEEV